MPLYLKNPLKPASVLVAAAKHAAEAAIAGSHTACQDYPFYRLDGVVSRGMVSF